MIYRLNSHAVMRAGPSINTLNSPSRSTISSELGDPLYVLHSEHPLTFRNLCKWILDHISSEERNRRITHHLCLYCGEPGRLRNACPSRPNIDSVTRVSVTLFALNDDHCLTVPVALETPSGVVQIPAMIDSGAAGNFMSLNFAQEHNISLIRCLSPLAVEAVDGCPLGTGKITHLTSRLMLTTGALHRQSIQFYIIPTAHASIILGLPWLRKHNPSISWRHSQIINWGANCLSQCISQVKPLVCKRFWWRSQTGMLRHFPTSIRIS